MANYTGSKHAIDTPGNHTWTVPAGVTSIAVLVIGGGGGGGTGNRSGGPGGGGGGSGGVGYITDLPVTPGEVYTIGIGVGGIGGRHYKFGHQWNGQDGTATVFHKQGRGNRTLLYAGGGNGGKYGRDGGAGGANGTCHSGADGNAFNPQLKQGSSSRAGYWDNGLSQGGQGGDTAREGVTSKSEGRQIIATEFQLAVGMTPSEGACAVTDSKAYIMSHPRSANNLGAWNGAPPASWLGGYFGLGGIAGQGRGCNYAGTDQNNNTKNGKYGGGGGGASRDDAGRGGHGLVAILANPPDCDYLGVLDYKWATQHTSTGSCTGGTLQNKVTNNGNGCSPTSEARNNGQGLINGNTFKTKHASGHWVTTGIYSATPLTLSKNVSYLDCTVETSMAITGDVMVFLTARVNGVHMFYQWIGTNYLSSKWGNNKKFTFKIDTKKMIPSTLNGPNVISFNKGTKIEFGLGVGNSISSTTTTITKFDICVKEPPGPAAFIPVNVVTANKPQMSMSQLAVRGGHATFSFPNNWRNTIRREGARKTITGVGGWSYGYAKPGTRQVVIYDAAKDTHPNNAHILRGCDTHEVFPLIASNGHIHPHTDGAGNYQNIIKWVAPYTGKAEMFISVNTIHHACGNGIIFWLARMKSQSSPANGANVKGMIFGPKDMGNIQSNQMGFNTTRFNGNSNTSNILPHFYERKTINITKGDCFYFVCGPNSNPNCDSTAVQWEIVYKEGTVDFSGTQRPGSDFAGVSLRHATEELARGQVLMPNYRHGQNHEALNKFSDRGELSNVHMSDFLDTAFTPQMQNTGWVVDTNLYHHIGNGGIGVTSYFSPTMSDWWNNGGSDRPTITNMQFQLKNHNPPPGVSFANNIEKSWRIGGYRSGISTPANIASWGPGATPWIWFDTLVGGNYRMEWQMNWKTKYGAYNIRVDTGHVLQPAPVVLEGHLYSNYGTRNQR